MITDILLKFGVSLGATLVIEILLALIFGVRNKKGLLIVLLVNTLTNPAAVLICWLADLYFFYGFEFLVEIAVEIAVVVLEAKIYMMFIHNEEFKIRYPVRMAVVCNLVSWLTGIVLGQVYIHLMRYYF